jgi:hypothetical protein
VTSEYAAGFFDGEGCISVNWNDNCPSIIVMVVNVHQGVLQQLEEKYRGHHCRRANGIFQWARTGKVVLLSFLHDILPHLVIKQEVAALAILIAELPHGNKLSPEQKQRRNWLAHEIHRLNQLRTTEAS